VRPRSGLRGYLELHEIRLFLLGKKIKTNIEKLKAFLSGDKGEKLHYYSTSCQSWIKTFLINLFYKIKIEKF